MTLSWYLMLGAAFLAGLCCGVGTILHFFLPKDANVSQDIARALNPGRWYKGEDGHWYDLDGRE